jgi:hypothetical protein
MARMPATGMADGEKELVARFRAYEGGLRPPAADGVRAADGLPAAESVGAAENRGAADLIVTRRS